MSKAHNRTQEERDDQFLLETLKNNNNIIKGLMEGIVEIFPGMRKAESMRRGQAQIEDNNRCIKILEERKAK